MLKESNIDAYSLEARLIAAEAAEKTKEEFLRDSGLYVAEDYEDKVIELLKRRIKGEPVAYITGEWEFYGLPIKVSTDVLIPRTDTEVLVDRAIDELKEREPGARILDLCSGSGCVGLAIAANVQHCKVVLVDKSVKALKLSRSNVLINNLTRSVMCIEGDAMTYPPMLLGQFDMIVCNPPYIPTDDIPKLDSSVKDHEPLIALDGGADGLDFYRSIASKWTSLLKENGALLFEVGVGQAADVKTIMEENGFKEISVYKDTIEVERVVKGLLLQ